MISKIIKAITSLFSKNNIGILFKILAIKAGSAIAKEIMNPQNQQKAYEFVKDLASRKDLTNKEKADEFNKKMKKYLKSLGKKIADSTINCLRELAVNAFKCESEEAE